MKNGGLDIGRHSHKPSASACPVTGHKPKEDFNLDRNGVDMNNKTGRFEDIDYEGVAADIAARPPSKWVPLIHPELQNVNKNDDHSFTATWRNLCFVASAGIENDGKDWLHVSVSRADKRMPTYENLMDLKRLCIGDHHTAYQVFPVKEKYVNLASMDVLHLWCCLDGEVTPDFTRGFGTI